MIILTDPSIDGRQHLLVVAGIVLFTVFEYWCSLRCTVVVSRCQRPCLKSRAKLSQAPRTMAKICTTFRLLLLVTYSI